MKQWQLTSARVAQPKSSECGAAKTADAHAAQRRQLGLTLEPTYGTIKFGVEVALSHRVSNGQRRITTRRCTESGRCLASAADPIQRHWHGMVKDGNWWNWARWTEIMYIIRHHQSHPLCNGKLHEKRQRQFQCWRILKMRLRHLHKLIKSMTCKTHWWEQVQMLMPLNQNMRRFWDFFVNEMHSAELFHDELKPWNR